MSKPTNTIYSKDFAILKIKTLEKENKKLKNIIKEVREFVEKWKYKDGDGSVYFDINTNPDDLLRIIDK